MGLISEKGFKYRSIPKSLVLQFAKNFSIKSFIETGTYLGQTAIWAADQFERVITFEASQAIYDSFNEKNKTLPFPSNLFAYFGDSSVMLGSHIHENSIFHLDAHYSAGSTFKSYPLIKEIQQINKTSFDDFIIIDDAHFVMSKWDDERYCTLLEISEALIIKDRYVVVFDDMIIAAPQYARSLVDDYTNERSKIYLKTYYSSLRLKKYLYKLGKLHPYSLLRKLQDFIGSRKI